MKINVTPEMVKEMTPARLEEKIKYYLENDQIKTAQAYVNAYRKVEGFQAEKMEFLILKVEKGEYQFPEKKKKKMTIKRRKKAN